MKYKKQGGYAILFSVVVIGIILVIAFGLSNITYKQLVLSSLAKDSQAAFYQADLATECGLYHDWYQNSFTVSVDPETGSESGRVNKVSCAGIDLNVSYDSSECTDKKSTFCIIPQDQSSNNPCFRIYFEKDEIGNTTMRANGYNICDIYNNRTVERTIKVTY